MSTARAEFFDQVTHRIIADLDRGVRPWIKPWAGGASVSISTTNIRPNEPLSAHRIPVYKPLHFSVPAPIFLKLPLGKISPNTVRRQFIFPRDVDHFVTNYQQGIPAVIIF